MRSVLSAACKTITNDGTPLDNSSVPLRAPRMTDNEFVRGEQDGLYVRAALQTA